MGSLLSTTTAAFRRSTARPALSSPSRQAPDTSGVNVADTLTEHAPTVSCGCGGPIQRTRAVCAASVATGSPARSGLSKYETPSVSSPNSRRSIGGRPRSMRQPTSKLMEASGSRSASASSTRRRRCGVTSELPPPMASWPALGPITATLPTLAASNGNSPSLTRRTVPSVATRRATARRPGSSDSASSDAVGPPPRIPTRPISRRTWRTWPSTTDSSTSPERTAAAREGPSQADGPGISRSSPASAAGAVECVPNQSDMTSPSKPHSRRSTPPISSGCSPQ